MAAAENRPHRFENDYFGDWVGVVGFTDSLCKRDGIFGVNGRVDGYSRVNCMEGGEKRSKKRRGKTVRAGGVVNCHGHHSAVCRVRRHYQVGRGEMIPYLGESGRSHQSGGDSPPEKETVINQFASPPPLLLNK
jgi:hypothetical protein